MIDGRGTSRAFVDPNIAVDAPEYVVADWGGTGRGEETAGSDRDVIVWAPEAKASDWPGIVEDVARAEQPIGTYLDDLRYDGRRTLRSWALSTATDLQAVLFATRLRGPEHLRNAFVAAQDELWADQTVRATQVWLLSADVLQRPRIMADAGDVFRPEKFTPGATRTFSALSELWALFRGVRGPLPTRTGLTALEDLLRLRRGSLVDRYAEATAIRLEIERGRPAGSFSDDWLRCAIVARRAQAALMTLAGPWLQAHAGVPTEWAAMHFQALGTALPAGFPEARDQEPTVSDMLRAFYGSSAEVGELIRSDPMRWHVWFAATGNPAASADVLDALVAPVDLVSAADHRNIWLWALRHPNVSLATADRFLAEPGHRPMDYDAAARSRARHTG